MLPFPCPLYLSLSCRIFESTDSSLQMILSDTEKLAALGMIPLLEGISSATGGNHHSSNNHHAHPNSVVVHNGEGNGSASGGGWRYRCKYCTYTTESKTVFNVHQRTHTGDRPYRCRFCAYAAKQKSHVTLHERLHTGEKPYSCPYCSYRCSDPTALRSHKFSKHREMFLSEAASKAARTAK